MSVFGFWQRKAIAMGLMLSLLSHLTEWSESSEKHPSILMLGLDGAGKTTCLYKLKLNETVTTIRTVGFNVETVTPVPGLSFTVWDVGGYERIRVLWRDYYGLQGLLGVIFVVDSQDKDRFAETKRELLGVLRAPAMPRNIPVLILANKQDLPGAHSVSELTDELQLESLTQNPWHIQGTCATSGEGLSEGFRQLTRMTREFRSLNWG